VITDYHMHLRGRETDSAGEVDHTVEAVERYVEAAQAAGVDEIGVTEHVYYFTRTRALWHMPYDVEHCVLDIEPYVDAVVAAKERGLPVKLGLEVDYVAGRERETRDLLAPYPWDYWLGSIHFLDDFGIDGRPRLIDEVGVDETWRRYFDRLGLAAESGLFDSLSHPDLVKMWGDRPEPEVETELFETFAERISATGVCVEVSTAGLKRDVAEIYPDPRLLRACHARGTGITLASDAHVATQVGSELGRAVALAREVGYETVTVFEQREGRQEPLG
jgi:histidinol-phosphatase (PHP family)